MNLREAAQQAVSALELAQTDVHWELNSPTRKCLRKAEKALRAALAEPQEPVAWMLTENEKYGNAVVLKKHKPKAYDSNWWRLAPLYTAPPASVSEAPQRLPLTEEEIDAATAPERDALLDHIYEYGTVAEGVHERIRKLVRAIERAHGIGDSPCAS